jgi:hypothetical protein
LLLLNHPNTSGSPNDKEYGIDDFDTFDQWREKLDPHAQLINIVNGPSHGGDNPGPPSENEFLRYLNLGLHVAPTADQDNHRKNWGSAAETRTAVVAPELTKAALLSAMRSRHVYATEDRNLEIGFTVNGQPLGTVLSGNQVPSQGSTLSLELSITDADEPNALYTVDVFGDEVGGSAEADVIAQFDLEGNGTFSLDGITYSGGNEYFFLKITQTDDDGILRDSAWLAPVWFEPETTVTTGPSLTLGRWPRQLPLFQENRHQSLLHARVLS